MQNEQNRLEIIAKNSLYTTNLNSCKIDYSFEVLKRYIKKMGGFWLKPLSNKQLESWSREMLNAFMKLGEQHPEISAEIYVVAGL